MTTRYQHVTDTLRSQVASQIGDLIWDAPSTAKTEGLDRILARRDSLATVLAAAAECVARHGGGEGPLTDLLAAIEDLRSALSQAAGNPTETETETRRSPDR
jgi:hypothetical protein